MNKKIKILTLSDHPLSPSGVGTQTKYVCEALLKSGRFSVVSIGGAIKHQDYTPKIVEPSGEDWKVIPVDGYGSADMIRSILRTEKIDILWFMTDPRFWGWLWEMENEIRPLMPMVYYHVWDNYPYPTFNQSKYNSNDKIVTISKVTSDIVQTVSPNVDEQYIPHAVDLSIFKRRFSQEDRDIISNIRKQYNMENKVVFFWNNRNARRKQSGTLIYWFKEFLDEVGHDKASLIMHTDPKDPAGINLIEVAKMLKIENNVRFSSEILEDDALNLLYNISDFTLNISFSEGFGLSYARTLSGGMKRRLTIARSLMNRPELLLLDEPTTGLDPQARHVLWERLYRLKEQGVTLVLTTHYMDEAEQLCDRLVVMDRGLIVAEGTPRGLITEHSTKEVLELRLPSTISDAAERLADVGERVEVLPDRVLVYADDGEEALAESHRRGIEPLASLVRRSSLEDVFLRLTGRSLVE